MPEDPGESTVIAALEQGRHKGSGARPILDLGDDAAVTGEGMAMANDAMVEGVHFDHRLSPEDVGWKLVAANVSDMGAVGATPAWALLTLALPHPLDMTWVAGFQAGLEAACARWKVRLLGGDTVRSPSTRMASLFMGGPTLAAVSRSGAKNRDDVWVTGTLGDAAAGFVHGGAGLAWLRRPEPPVELGIALAEAGVARAMMDISDGLGMDLPRLCSASGVGALIDPAALPHGEQIADLPDRLSLQVAFGEDYQLLFTAAPADARLVQDLGRVWDTPVHRIGSITSSREVQLEGHAWPKPLFQHFPD